MCLGKKYFRGLENRLKRTIPDLPRLIARARNAVLPRMFDSETKFEAGARRSEINSLSEAEQLACTKVTTVVIDLNENTRLWYRGEALRSVKGHALSDRFSSLANKPLHHDMLTIGRTMRDRWSRYAQQFYIDSSATEGGGGGGGGSGSAQRSQSVVSLSHATVLRADKARQCAAEVEKHNTIYAHRIDALMTKDEVVQEVKLWHSNSGVNYEKPRPLPEPKAEWVCELAKARTAALAAGIDLRPAELTAADLGSELPDWQALDPLITSVATDDGRVAVSFDHRALLPSRPAGDGVSQDSQLSAPASGDFADFPLSQPEEPEEEIEEI